MINFDIHGLRECIQAYSRLETVVREAGEPAAHKMAKQLRIYVELGMQQPKSGMFWPGNRVASSAPDETPAVQTGELFGSLRDGSHATGNSGFGWFSAGDGVDIDKVIALEYAGTEKMAPRPFMRPAMDESHAWLRYVVKKEIEDAIAAAFGG